MTAQIWDRSACDYCAGNAESWEGKAGRIFRAIHSPVGEQDGEMAYVLSQVSTFPFIQTEFFSFFSPDK